MLKLAQVPQDQRTSTPHLDEVSQSRSHEQRYFAFLSYSHKDDAIADWVHRMLERFRVPPALAAQCSAKQIVPGTLRPIFRDRQELAAADDLGEEIRGALAASQFLIVLCSPAAAQSKWTNAEIDAFKRVNPNGSVLAAILAGEPFASEVPGHPQEECFPPALRRKYDRRGRPTSKRAEPVAADFRESGDGKRLGLLKLVAGMLGVGFDELVQREARRRRRRLTSLAVGSLAAMGITGALVTAAIDSRIAAFHAHDEARDQRSLALALQGREANSNGDAAAAQRLYEQALHGTAEAMRRNPTDPRRIFDHAQNVFYVGQLAFERGDKRVAENYMIEYRQLSGRLVELQPNNLKWRTEVHYADTNLGVMLFGERRFDEAAARFEDAAQEAKVLADAAPSDLARQAAVAQEIAWLADARFSQGQINAAVPLRQQGLAILNSLSSQGASDAQYQMELTNAQSALGSAYAATGESTLALEHFRAAVANSDRLIPLDNASSWYRTAIRAKLTLAAFALGAGNLAEAKAATRSACDLADKLQGQTADNRSWRTERRDCWLMRTRLALAVGRNSEAVTDAQHAVAMSKATASDDHAADSFGVARAYRLLGDAQHKLGNAAAADDAWSNALRAMELRTAETPPEMDEHARILERLGRSIEVAQIESRLGAIGYHGQK